MTSRAQKLTSFEPVGCFRAEFFDSLSLVLFAVSLGQEILPAAVCALVDELSLEPDVFLWFKLSLVCFHVVESAVFNDRRKGGLVDLDVEERSNLSDLARHVVFKVLKVK